MAIYFGNFCLNFLPNNFIFDFNQNWIGWANTAFFVLPSNCHNMTKISYSYPVSRRTIRYLLFLSSSFFFFLTFFYECVSLLFKWKMSLVFFAFFIRAHKSFMQTSINCVGKKIIVCHISSFLSEWEREEERSEKDFCKQTENLT